MRVIAEMVGTTRSRVNVFMGLFKTSGFIEGIPAKRRGVTGRSRRGSTPGEGEPLTAGEFTDCLQREGVLPAQIRGCVDVIIAGAFNS